MGVTVVIDLDRTQELSSECLRVMLLGYTKAMRGGHGFAVVNAHGHLRRALAAVGLCPPETDTAVYAAVDLKLADPQPAIPAAFDDELWFDDWERLFLERPGQFTVARLMDDHQLVAAGTAPRAGENPILRSR